MNARACALAVALAALGAARADAAAPFAYRGYYFILSRNPGYGLDDYKLILDRMAEDGANVLILWIGGGFASRRYPETFDYNREHRNVKEDFVRALIDHAHSRGIRVLLGLTPFAYDGVNRYGAAHPGLAATDAAGKPAVTGGIHSLGRGLCPSKQPARDFMLGYCRELWDDFYPNADGLFLEHSDYGTCACAECADGKGLRREWGFVEETSRQVWEKKPGALMMVYPQYAALGVEYDPRHVIFVAPHNARGLEKLKNPKVLWHGYWDDGMLWRSLCRTAATEGYAGVIPSMENITYENPHAFDTRWGPRGSAGWDDLLVRVTRLSFREGCARPDLSDEGFEEALRASLFDAGTPAGAVKDLLALHGVLDHWSGWTWRAGVMKLPEGPVDPAKLEPRAREAFERETLPALRELAAIAGRSAKLAGAAPTTRGERTLAEMARIARWVVGEWERRLPEGTLRPR